MHQFASFPVPGTPTADPHPLCACSASHPSGTTLFRKPPSPHLPCSYGRGGGGWLPGKMAVNQPINQHLARKRHRESHFISVHLHLRIDGHRPWCMAAKPCSLGYWTLTVRTVGTSLLPHE